MPRMKLLPIGATPTHSISYASKKYLTEEIYVCNSCKLKRYKCWDQSSTDAADFLSLALQGCLICFVWLGSIFSLGKEEQSVQNFGRRPTLYPGALFLIAEDAFLVGLHPEVTAHGLL